MNPNDPAQAAAAMGGVMPPQPPQMPGQPMPGAPGQIDPATVQALLAMQQMGGQQAAIERQRKLADAMRGDAKGQLQGKYAGRVYVAPNALNLAASVASGLKAGKLGDDADTREKNLGVQKSDAMQRYFDAITGQKRPALPYMGEEGE